MTPTLRAAVAAAIYGANGGANFNESIHGANFWLRCADAALLEEVVEAGEAMRARVRCADGDWPAGEGPCQCDHCEHARAYDLARAKVGGKP